MLLKKKIILGTVQLGIPYGINNAAGKPSEAEAFRILDFAHANNIDTLDSADNYGEALQVIGRHRKVTGKVTGNDADDAKTPIPDPFPFLPRFDLRLLLRTNRGRSQAGERE